MSSTAQEQLARPTPPPGPPLPVQLLQLTVGTMLSQMVSVAARFGVPDAIADGPRSCEDIAAAVGAHAPSLYRLLRGLSTVGVVAELDDRRFALTPLGELLRSDVPGSLRGWAVFTGLPLHRNPWTDLYETVRTGETAFLRTFGTDLFSHLAENADDAAAFDAAMSSLAVTMQSAIVGAYDFSGCTTVVDAGGGDGTLLAAILRANPGLRGVLLDQADVLCRAAGSLQRSGVADRISMVEGDITADVPATGDLYLLSNILHDWDDEVCLRILSACQRAMPRGARLLVVELVLPESPAPSVAKQVDVEMLVTTGGRQRTAREFEALLSQAGLRLTRAVASILGEPASYVEAVRD